MGSTAAPGSTATGSAADTEAIEFEYEQNCLKGMQANSTEGFQDGDDAGTETTHSLAYVHACTPARVHIHT
jgi:hypothetical protein